MNILPKLIIALLSASTALFGVSQRDVLASTLILEAGGEYETGAMEAVYEVILKRAEKRNMSPAAVCLQPKQFSCWNNVSVRKYIAKAKQHPRYSYALSIVTSTTRTNYTKGADHYHADYVYPYWANTLKKTCKIGRHIFYR